MRDGRRGARAARAGGGRGEQEKGKGESADGKFGRRNPPSLSSPLLSASWRRRHGADEMRTSMLPLLDPSFALAVGVMTEDV